jgi:hypothetical protein
MGLGIIHLTLGKSSRIFIPPNVKLNVPENGEKFEYVVAEQYPFNPVIIWHDSSRQ